jgi:hypothetical protein
MGGMNLKQQLKGIDGKPLIRVAGNATTPTEYWTLGPVLADACLYQERDERLSAKDHITRYELAKRCMGDTIDLTSEEVVLLRNQVAKGFTVIIAGPTLQLLPA